MPLSKEGSHPTSRKGTKHGHPQALEGTSPTHTLTLVILVRLTLDSGLKLKENTFVLTSATRIQGRDLFQWQEQTKSVTWASKDYCLVPRCFPVPSSQPPIMSSALFAFNPSPTRHQDQPDWNPAFIICLRRQWVGRNGPQDIH